MNNIINKTYIKTSTKLRIKRKNGKMYVFNNSCKREKIIFNKIIFTDRLNFVLSNSIKTIKGQDCNIKILNRKFKVVHSLEQNATTYYNEVPKAFLIGISFEPNSEYEIKDLSYELNTTDENHIKDYFENKILLVCPGYPSNSNKYLCSFIHSRVNEYEKQKMHVDVAVVNELYINKTEFYEFEGKKICRTGYNQIRLLLLDKHYDKILIHFPGPEYYRILDAVDIRNTQVLLYSHGVDTLYRAYDRIGAPYFKNEFKIPDDYAKEFRDRDEGIKRYNNRPNFKFIFASHWNKNYSEKLLNIKYNNFDLVPCFIDDKLYAYKEKDEKLRKKVFIIRPQNNLKTYSMDINVRVILELSHRECFKDMEFSIYGDGDMHDKLLAPLKKFKNVHIYKTFLSHDEIAKMHKKHGIGLFASRFDTQAVSACEAAMSGNVVITSKGIGTEEFIDPKIGTYCETENYKEYADLIEKIYNDPKLFKKMSKEMHESVMKTCSYNYSLKKDIQVIKNFKEKEKINIPTLKKNPTLSISIASYNISKFVIQIVCSLLRSKYADELEILIVNDGSKDDTINKISKFVKDNYHKKGEPVVRIIDKPNGGHGSTINKGLELATAKYFKLLDGDDYYVTEELDKLIEKLHKEDSDLILTNYIEDFSVTGEFNRTRMYEELTPGIKYLLEDITYNGYGFSSWGPLLHTATYKTKMLQESNFKIDEHCFYVDMEYNFIGFIVSKTVTYYPFDIYSYYLGRQGQSVSPASFRKNVLQHEKVCMRLIEEFEKRKSNIPFGKQQYIIDRLIVHMCKTQYIIVTEYFKNNKNFKSFDNKLKKYPEFYNDNRIVGRRIKFHRKTKGLLLFLNPLLMKMIRK